MPNKNFIIVAVIVLLLVCAAAWTVAASYLFLWVGDLFPYFPNKWDRMTAWWLYLSSNNTSDKWVRLYLAGSAFVAAAPALLLVPLVIRSRYRQKKLTGSWGGKIRPIELGVTDNHGHARWPTIKEMMARYPKPPADQGGVVIGEARRIDLEPVANVPFDSSNTPNGRATWGMGGKAPLLIDPCTSGSPHSLMFVGTGGFKTMNAISTQFHWRGSVVTFDPSREIGNMVQQRRQNLGQRVVFIGYEPHHEGINALGCIHPERPGASSRILSMTASMCGEEPERKDKNSVFASAGRNLIACLIAHMMYSKEIPENLKTVQTLVEGITIPENDMQAKLRQISASSHSQLARRLASTIMGTAKETFSGAYFNAGTMTGWMMDAENAKLLSGTLDPAEVLKGGLSIYIQIPTATLMFDQGVGRVIADSIVNSVILADGRYAEPILFQADEARLLGPMKSLEVVLTMGRKYGLFVQLIYTSLNDMRRIWTDDGLETWLDLVGWSGYAAVSSKTAEYLSKAIGKTGVMAYSEGSNRGVSGQTLGNGSRSRGSNTNVHEIGRALINPEEFKDSRTDELFVFPRSGRPFRCGLAPYFRRPEMVAEIQKTTFFRGRAA